MYSVARTVVGRSGCAPVQAPESFYCAKRYPFHLHCYCSQGKQAKLRGGLNQFCWTTAWLEQCQSLPPVRRNHCGIVFDMRARLVLEGPLIGVTVCRIARRRCPSTTQVPDMLSTGFASAVRLVWLLICAAMLPGRRSRSRLLSWRAPRPRTRQRQPLRGIIQCSGARLDVHCTSRVGSN